MIQPVSCMMTMRIVVCINDPDYINNLKAKTINKDHETPTILDTDNENALEAALKIKDENPDTEVIAIAAGPPEVDELLRESIAKGADDGILLSDESFDYTNMWTMATVLVEGIKRIDSVDLILAGKQSFDLGIIQITPQLAENLGMPLISQVSSLEINKENVTAGSMLENSNMILETKQPCILSIIKEINTPRYTTIIDMMNSLKVDIKTYNAADLGLDQNNESLNQPVDTLLSFPLKPREKGITIEGDNAEDIVSQLMTSLRKRTVL